MGKIVSLSPFNLLCLFLLTFILSLVSGKTSDEKIILLEFKKSISDPNGVLKSWNSDNPNHCSWFGVSCDSNLKVSRLRIQGNLSLAPSCSLKSELSLHGFGIQRNCSDINEKLVGKLSPVIGNLTDLIVLSLPFNEFDGEIPIEIFGLKNLQVLDLEGNYIVGNFLRYEFTGLTDLKVLNLAFNRISGKFPPSLSKCRVLRTLNLAGNVISDSIPNYIGCLKMLRVINLSFNRLIGYVPRNLGSDCGNIEHLDLSANFLNGEIPRALGNCSRLRTLLLSSNALSGTIPKELGNIRGLQVLDVSRNSLRGALSADLGNCPDLSILVLTSHFDDLAAKWSPCGDCNSFEGSIPDEITSLPNLQILWAPDANLSGEFPTSWGSCESLKIVNLAQNSFTGEIMDTLSICTDLQYLNFSLNPLAGRFSQNLQVSDPRACRDVSSMENMQVPPVAISSSVAYLSFFLNKTLPTDPDPQEQCNKQKKSQKHHPHHHNWLAEYQNEDYANQIILLTCLTSLIVTAIACLAWYCYLERKKQILNNIPTVTPPPSSPPQIGELRMFNDIGVPLTYDTIVQGTGNFNRSNCIGNGGFGSTYKAEISPGNFVAVKRLTASRHQGAPQFHAEVNVLGRVKHPNLITLIGYYSSQAEMFLIYNYLPGGNLDRFIRDRDSRPFDWTIIHKIALDIASVLSFLHDECNPCILHRDIKPSNILLDEELNAYLADFGLSRVLNGTATHAVTRVAGTYGYIAPDYASTGRVSSKADVYSYGVVLLELLSDKRVLDPSFYLHENGYNIVSWAHKLQAERRKDEFFATSLWESAPRDKLARLFNVAICCTWELGDARPPMKDVVERLKRIGPEPTG